MHIFMGPQTYLLEVKKQTGLPKLPKEGVGSSEDLKKVRKVVEVPDQVESMVGPEKYAYRRTNVRRNIYRVPIG